MTAQEWRYLLRWLQLPAGAQLLDVGCGSSGPVLYAAQRLGVRVCGVDSNASAIEAGQAFEDFQRFFDVVYDLSSQRRLSRYVFLAARPV